LEKRKKIIFKLKTLTIAKFLEIIMTDVKESIADTSWSPEDLKLDRNEFHIFKS